MTVTAVTVVAAVAVAGRTGSAVVDVVVDCIIDVAADAIADVLALGGIGVAAASFEWLECMACLTKQPVCAGFHPG